MTSRTITTAWNLFFHYTAFALVLTSGVVLVPLYLKYIPVDLYGAWLATGNVLAWMTMVDPGISTIVMQRVAVSYGNKDAREVYAFVSGGIALSLAVAVLVIVGGFLIEGYLPGWLRLVSNEHQLALREAFRWAIAGTALSILSYGMTAVNQGLQSSLGIGLIYVVSNVAAILATVWLLLAGHGVAALGIAVLIRGAGLCLGNAGYLAWRLTSDLRGFRLSFAKISELFRLTRYQFLGQIGGTLSTQIDSFVIARYLGPEVVPVLILTRRAPDTLKMLAERPAVAFMPAIAHAIGAGEFEKARTALLLLMHAIVWILGLLVGGFLCLNDDFVRLWVGPELFAGYAINLIICAILLLSVLTRSFANLCMAMGNIKGNNVAAIIESLVFVPLVLLGAQSVGLIGVALAPLLAMVAVSVWYYPRSFQKLLRLEVSDLAVIAWELARAMIVAGILAVSFERVVADSWLEFAGLVTSFSLLYWAGLYAVSKRFRNELRRLSSWVLPLVTGLERWPHKFGQPDK